MTTPKSKLTSKSIQDKIITIRNVQVIFDSDLSEMYLVETRVLNQAVKRNIDRFPIDFMFQLSKIEYDTILKSQTVISKLEHGGRRKLPFVFTEQGVFFSGQIFDAWVFISEVIKSAENSIIIIDNYIDESVLNLLLKKRKNVNVKIYTSNLSDHLKTDIEKFSKQYFKIDVVITKKAHDRFLIIDNKLDYHIGASLKDLGKKLFGFSKMEVNPDWILKNMT